MLLVFTVASMINYQIAIVVFLFIELAPSSDIWKTGHSSSSFYKHPTFENGHNMFYLPIFNELTTYTYKYLYSSNLHIYEKPTRSVKEPICQE